MSKKKLFLRIGIGLVAFLVLTAILLPSILQWAGLHPKYEGERYSFSDKRALIITTSHGELGDTGNRTGVYASEMTIPYYEFSDSGIQVDVASIRGSEIPIDPMSMRYPLITPSDWRFRKDAEFQNKVINSLSIIEVDFSQYDLILLTGGWGASYDFGNSEILGERISEAYAHGVILGSVCHGALGFLQARDTNGMPLIYGRRMTAVTNKQVEELNISITPMHPETKLRQSGAEFESVSAFRDFFATHVVVDGLIVTGQNQNSSAETANIMMRILNERHRQQ